MIYNQQLSAVEILAGFDRSLTFLLARALPNIWPIDEIFSFLSLTGNYVVVWLIILSVIFFRQKKHLVQHFLLFIISVALTILSVHYLIKPIVQRHRPLAAGVNSFSCPTDYGFPSGHAAGAFVAAAIISLADKKRRYWYYLAAALIAYSRIYFRCHYFLDVVFGAFYGYFIGRLVIYLTTYKKILFKSKKN